MSKSLALMLVLLQGCSLISDVPEYLGPDLVQTDTGDVPGPDSDTETDVIFTDTDTDIEEDAVDDALDAFDGDTADADTPEDADADITDTDTPDMVDTDGGDSDVLDPDSEEEDVIIDPDQDEDGFPASVDCDDHNNTVYPGAPELCDTLDNNCNEQIDEGVQLVWFADADGDGWGDPDSTVLACMQPEGYVRLSGDCNDLPEEGVGINPDAIENCETDIDEDCDPRNDNTGSLWCLDSDHDGYGDPRSCQIACAQPEGYVRNTTDCNDDRSDVNPEGIEVCDEALVDENCDGEAQLPPVWLRDRDGDGFGNPNDGRRACTQPEGYVTQTRQDCQDDPNQNGALINPEAEERCNGVDDDCDGLIDDDDIPVAFPFDWYPDRDRDGYGDALSDSIRACAMPAPPEEEPDLRYSRNNIDCNDADDTIRPGIPESCDEENIDNNCNPQDDQEGSLWCRDEDEDGFGNENNCVLDCEQPTGFVLAALGFDCNDARPDIHPDAEEVCDEEGLDEDCDPETLRPPTRRFRDADMDGSGDPDIFVETCLPQEGFVENDDDCDDENPELHRNSVWFADTDRDGYGTMDEQQRVVQCLRPTGFSSVNTDCDDRRAEAYPGANERCNDLDDNCNQQIDEGLPLFVFYVDNDGDTYGDTDAPSVSSCHHRYVDPNDPEQRYVRNNTDCDDLDETIHPFAYEICDDGVDQDCNPTNEQTGSAWYTDQDRDGFGRDGIPFQDCADRRGDGFASRPGDCQDTIATIHPNAEEVCDSADNNCYAPDNLILRPYYLDEDDDGFGDRTRRINLCEARARYVTNRDDCDDTRADINPNGREISIIALDDTFIIDNRCDDGRDNNCNDLVDANDPQCQDTDVDGIENGIDPIWHLGTALCLPLAQSMPEGVWQRTSAIRQGEHLGGFTSLDPDQDTDPLDFICQGGVGIDFALEGLPQGTYNLSWVSTRSTDGVSLASPDDCSSWVRVDLTAACDLTHEEFCQPNFSSDGCRLLGRTIRVVWDGQTLQND